MIPEWPAPALDAQERVVDGQHVPGAEMLVGAGDHPPVGLDEQSERSMLDGARAVARQRVLQHRRELRFRVEHDRHAADRLLLLRRADRRPIDVSRAAFVERGRHERGHHVALRVPQRQNARDPFLRQRRAGELAPAALDAATIVAVAVEDDEIGVDGVETVDRAQDRADGLRVLVEPPHARQDVDEIRRQSPPSAVVGPLVEISIHDVDGERRMELVVAQQRRHDRFVQVGDRAFEDVLGSRAGDADLLEQNLRECCRSRFRGSLLRDIAVPHGTVQLALNERGLRRDIADFLGEQRRCVNDPVEHLGLDAREHLRCILVERMRDRHHDVAVPSGSAIALIWLRGAAGGDVFHRTELHDPIFRIQDRRQPGSERNMNRIRAGDDDAGVVQDRDHGPIVVADEVREYQLQFVLESEAKAEDAEHRAVGIGDAESIDQRLLPARNKVASRESSRHRPAFVSMAARMSGSALAVVAT